MQQSNQMSPDNGGVETKMRTHTANSSVYENQQDLQTVRLSYNNPIPAQVESTVSVNDIENTPQTITYTTMQAPVLQPNIKLLANMAQQRRQQMEEGSNVFSTFHPHAQTQGKFFRGTSNEDIALTFDYSNYEGPKSIVRH